MANKSILAEILQKHEKEILEEWINILKGGRGKTGRLKEGELDTQTQDVLGALRAATESGVDYDLTSERYSALREILSNISRSRALQSYTSSETATFVLSLKEPIFNRLGKSISDAASLRREIWSLTLLIDQLALLHDRCFPAIARRGDQAPATGIDGTFHARRSTLERNPCASSDRHA